eukprot:scaffold28238_cov148-Isochrysis_galbana.AAC.2
MGSHDLLLLSPFHLLLAAALIKAVSNHKPTQLEPFAVHWLGVNYKKDLSPEMSARGSHDGWTSRSGVFSTEQELTAYLLEIRLPMLLEVAVSAAALAEEEAINFEAKMLRRAAALSGLGEGKAKPDKLHEKVSGGTHLELSYDVGEDGHLSVDFSVTTSAVVVGP